MYRCGDAVRIHLCHGIHTPENSPAVMGLIPYLKAAGFEVAFPDYPWIAALQTRLVNPIIVACIKPYIEAGDIWIGHSNGAAIGYDLMHVGAPLAGAIFINGALDTKLVRPPQVKWIDVLFNPQDQITEAAQIAERLGWVDAVWGELGHRGYTGSDAAIRNYDCGLTPGLPTVQGHSDLFTVAKLAAWGPWIAKRLSEQLKTLATAALASI